MFLLIHVLLGALIGLKFNSLTIIVVIGILSHFIIDMIPHWDGNFNKNKFYLFGIADLDKERLYLSIFDIILSVSLLLFLYQYLDSWVVIFAALMAVSPDIANLAYLTKLKRNKHYLGFLKFHSKIQRDTGIKKGLIIQMIFAIILIILLFIFK